VVRSSQVAPVCDVESEEVVLAVSPDAFDQLAESEPKHLPALEKFFARPTTVAPR
jgi:hypothetical protein